MTAIFKVRNFEKPWLFLVVWIKNISTRNFSNDESLLFEITFGKIGPF